MAKPNLDHPSLGLIKARFPDVRFMATEFRGQSTVIVPPEHLHQVMQFLRESPDCAYDMLSDIVGVDYLGYPKGPEGRQPAGRFGVIYILVSTRHNRRLYIKALLDPSLDTRGIEPDPALQLPTVTDIWPGAEWMEREVYDMFGIRFDGHGDLRRILLWEDYPAHPLRKDYPVTGRGERESYRIVDRDSA